MTPAVEAENLSFGFQPGRLILREICFRVEAGERVAIVGANGAGKSTLLWCLLGLHRFQGQVRLLGLPPAEARGRVGVVFQNSEDQLFMPAILEDAALALYNRGWSRAEALERARATLAAMGLAAQAQWPARHLSLGQRKRAAIAAALAARPELLVMDEPTAELDGRAVRQLRAALERLELTLLIAGHHVEFLRQTTTRAIVLEGGLVLADGPTPEVLGDAALLERAGLL